MKKLALFFLVFFTIKGHSATGMTTFEGPISNPTISISRGTLTVLINDPQNGRAAVTVPLNKIILLHVHPSPPQKPTTARFHSNLSDFKAAAAKTRANMKAEELIILVPHLDLKHQWEQKIYEAKQKMKDTNNPLPEIVE